MDRGLNRHLLDRLAVEGVRLAEGDGGSGGDGGQGDGGQGGDNGAQGAQGGTSGGGSGDGPGNGQGDAQGAAGGQSGDTGGQGDGSDLSQLSPDQLARMVRDLRRENGAARTNAKDQAATEAKKELAQEVGKMLGLVEDDTSDPDKLKDQLGSAQQKQREADIKLAVYENASEHGAHPGRLLNSRRFFTAASKLDPSSDAFADDIGKAIKAEMEADESVKAAQGAPRSGGEFTGGSGGGRKRTGNLAAAVRGTLNKE